MTGCCPKAAPLCAVAEGWVVMPSCVAPAVVPDAVKLTGLPVSPLAVAVTVLLLVPALGPRVQLVAVAMPEASVITVAGPAGTTVPPPAVTANVTATPAIGLLPVSVTLTDGGALTAVLTGALWLVTELAEMIAAAPAVMLIVPDVAPVKLGAEKPRVRFPMVPVMDRLVKVCHPARVGGRGERPAQCPTTRRDGGGDDHARLAHRIAGPIPKLNDRLLPEDGPARRGRRGLGGDAELRRTCGRDADGVRRRTGQAGRREAEGAIAGGSGDREPRKRGETGPIGRHYRRAAQRSATRCDRGRDVHSCQTHRVPRGIAELNRRLLGKRDTALRGRRGLGGDGELCRGSGRDGDGPGGDADITRRREEEGPVADGPRNREVVEGRDAAPVRGGSERPAKRPGAGLNRRGHHHACLGDRVVGRVAELDDRLLRERHAACAVPEGGVVMASWLAAPAVIVMTDEAVPVSPALENPRVRSPAVPVIESPANVARPAPLVATVAVPPIVPPPDAIAAVMFTPARLTAFPAASRS